MSVEYSCIRGHAILENGVCPRCNWKRNYNPDINIGHVSEDETMKEVCECCGMVMEICQCGDVGFVQRVARAEALMEAIDIAGKMNSTYDIIEALKDMLRDTT